MSSNSNRIETATRQHVGATLTSAQITELVKLSYPDWKGGVYPSDCAGKRQEDGTLTHRGKTAYGDLVLEYVGENNFKVLPTEQIIRRKNPPNQHQHRQRSRRLKLLLLLSPERRSRARPANHPLLPRPLREIAFLPSKGGQPMEHIFKVAEAALAVFGSMKFLHECYELLHGLAKLFKR